MIRPARPSRTEFLKSIGVVGAAALTGGVSGCGGSIGSLVTPSGAAAPFTYGLAAAAGFEVLVQQYKTPHIFDGNFWFGGTTLHTCLDYLVAAGETDQTFQVLPAAMGTYQSLSGNPGMVEGRLRLVGRGIFVRHRSSPAARLRKPSAR